MYSLGLRFLIQALTTPGVRNELSLHNARSVLADWNGAAVWQLNLSVPGKHSFHPLSSHLTLLSTLPLHRSPPPTPTPSPRSSQVSFTEPPKGRGRIKHGESVDNKKKGVYNSFSAKITVPGNHCQKFIALLSLHSL